MSKFPLYYTIGNNRDTEKDIDRGGGECGDGGRVWGDNRIGREKEETKEG